jgi:poly-gamma-glutamate synthesis protein (capsule biosynthesis protein)
MAFVHPVSDELLRGTDPFRAVRAELVGADLTFGNLECVLSERRAPPYEGHERPGVLLRGPCAAGETLRAAGFDVVSLANNHAYDLGGLGAAESRGCVLGAGVAVVGGGQGRAEARAPWVTTVRGTRVGVLAFTFDTNRYAHGTFRVSRLDDDAAGAVRALRPQVDVLLVSVHWGTEFVHQPNPYQRAFARTLVNAGADAILGHHPHVLQGVELVRGRPVFYSLGNFLFGPEPGPRGWSAVLSLDLDRTRGVTAARLLPVRLLGHDGVPTPAPGPEGDPLRAVVTSASGALGTRFTNASGVLELLLPQR